MPNYITNSESKHIVNTWKTQFRRIFRMKSWEEIPERQRLIYALMDLDLMKDRDPIGRIVEKKLAGDGYTAANRVQALTLYRAAYFMHQSHDKPKWWMFLAKRAYNREARHLKEMEVELIKKGCPRDHILAARNDEMQPARIIEESIARQREERINAENLLRASEVANGTRNPDRTQTFQIEGETFDRVIHGIKYSDYKFNETNKINDTTFGDNFINEFVADMDTTARRLVVQANQNLAIRKTMGKKANVEVVNLEAIDEGLEEKYMEIYEKTTVTNANGKEVDLLTDEQIKQKIEVDINKAEDKKEVEEIKEAPKKKKRGRPRKISVEKAEDEKDKWTEVSKDDFISEIDEEIKSEVSLEREAEDIEEIKTEADILAEKYMNGEEEREPVTAFEDTSFDELKLS